MKTLQAHFDELIKNETMSITDESQLDDVANRIEQAMVECIAKATDSSLKIFREPDSDSLRMHRKTGIEFPEMIFEVWREGFDSLDTLIFLCIETGSQATKALSSKEPDASDASAESHIKFSVIIKLHAKACLIAKEIVCLLKNGFADGAHGRWRALHEVTATALFISQHPPEIAERYCMHEIVDSYKGAKALKEVSHRVQVKPLPDEEFDDLEKQYEFAIQRYGKSFADPYGWTEPALRKRANFTDIEKSVSLDHLRPYYKWASQNIHASAKSLSSSLALDIEGPLLVGPSDLGMIDPAHSTAISLTQITCCILSIEPTIDHLVWMKAISEICNDVGENFLKCRDQNFAK